MEKFEGQQAGIQGLVGQLQQKNQAEEQSQKSTGFGILKLLGGFVLTATGNPLGPALFASGASNF